MDQARSTFLSGGARHDIRVDLSPDLPRGDGRSAAHRPGAGQPPVQMPRKTRPPWSNIRVTAVRRSVHVAISVTDEGKGVPAEVLPHLFRKFSRLDSEVREAGIGGTGLGLAICKGIVEAHGGRIWAESDGTGLGLGSPSPFRRPRCPGTLPRGRRRSPRRGRGGSAGTGSASLRWTTTPQTLRYVRAALSEAGYAPSVTGDPEAVGRLMEETRPHLVILDLMLPGADGIKLMESIPGLSNVPVIFLSAYGGDQIVARALEKGADDYIVKPLSPTELVARIQAVLRRWTASGSAELPQHYALGELTVDYAERRVSLAGRPVQLTDIEYGMLFELSVNAGRVLTHGELLQRVWGPAHSVRTGAVRSVVKNLRRQLGDDAENPAYIFNEPRVGYRMPKAEEDVEA